MVNVDVKGANFPTTWTMLGQQRGKLLPLSKLATITLRRANVGEEQLVGSNIRPSRAFFQKLYQKKINPMSTAKRKKMYQGKTEGGGPETLPKTGSPLPLHTNITVSHPQLI